MDNSPSASSATSQSAITVLLISELVKGYINAYVKKELVDLRDALNDYGKEEEEEDYYDGKYANKTYLRNYGVYVEWETALMYFDKFIDMFPLLLSMSFDDMNAGIKIWSLHAGEGIVNVICLYEKIKEMREEKFAEYIQQSSLGYDTEDAENYYTYLDQHLKYHKWPLTERKAELEKTSGKHTKAAPRNIMDDDEVYAR